MSGTRVGTDGKLRLLGKPERELVVEEAQTTIHHTEPRDLGLQCLNPPLPAHPTGTWLLGLPLRP